MLRSDYINALSRVREPPLKLFISRALDFALRRLGPMTKNRLAFALKADKRLWGLGVLVSRNHASDATAIDPPHFPRFATNDSLMPLRIHASPCSVFGRPSASITCSRLPRTRDSLAQPTEGAPSAQDSATA